MGKCEVCGKDLFLPFTCKYCGEDHCGEHRLPEHHNCGIKWKRVPGKLFSSKIYTIEKHIPRKDKTHILGYV